MDAVIKPVSCKLDPVSVWRKFIFERVFGGLAIICIPIYLTSVYLCIVSDLWMMAAVDTFAYMILLVAVFNKRLPQHCNYLLGSALAYIIGIAFLVTIGPSGAGWFWLFIFPPLAILMLGSRAGQWAQLLNFISIVIVGVAYHFNLLSWPQTSGYNSFIYGVVALNFFVTNALLTFAITFVMEKMINKIEQDNATVAALSSGMSWLSEYQHSQSEQQCTRLQRYVQVLGNHLLNKEDKPDELDEIFVMDLSTAATLHDIGNIEVSQSILLKNSVISADEHESLKHHTLAGAEISRVLHSIAPNSDIIRLVKQVCTHHHENWDGSGYPQGLVATAIPLAARLVRICDVYDAMTSKRCHREAISHTEAVEHIKAECGQLFDPLLVDCFVEVASQFNLISQSHVETSLI
ncbi:HD-GYP domain-containing protein [Shewanella maritima]|uniref:HD-GYP domain-containing protein n=1 Tax=Shewanella maritima TaxID=2520507 RepID=UPI0037363B27